MTSKSICCEKRLSIKVMFVWGTIQESHFSDDCWVVWFVVINGNANATRHEGQCESSDNADVRNSIFQTSEAFAIDKEQQRHQTQGHDAGASGHYDAGRVSEREETLLHWHAWNVNISNGTCKTSILFCRKISVYCSQLCWHSLSSTLL